MMKHKAGMNINKIGKSKENKKMSSTSASKAKQTSTPVHSQINIHIEHLMKNTFFN